MDMIQLWLDKKSDINLWEGIILMVFFKSQLLKITPHNPPHPQNSSLTALL